MKGVRILLLVACSVPCACRQPRGPGAVDSVGSASTGPGEGGPVATGDSRSFLTGSGRLLRVARGPDLDVRAVWDFGGRVVRLDTRERTLAGEWVTSSQSWSTSFDITDLGSAGSHALFVAGVTERGEDVALAWRLDLQAGSWHTELAAAPASVFEPPFQLPLHRPQRRSPARTVVFQGDLPGIPVHVVASADASRVHALFGEPEPTGLVPNTLYTISVAAGTAAAVFSSDSDVFMQAGFMGMSLLEHPVQGYALLLHGIHGTGVAGNTILYDSDGDGELEAGVFLDFAETQALGITRSSWSEVSG